MSLIPNEGACIRVERERWVAAQEWERAHWVNSERERARFAKNVIWRVLSACGLKPKYRGDDSNLWWRDQFDRYSFLPPTLDNAIELGCGPYTNMRHILAHCSPAHVILSDPLIRTYVHFPLAFVAAMYRAAFCTLDDHPAEECPFASDYFDLVVMTNVLDHVRDADLCIKEAARITKPGGFLIMGQEMSDDDDAKAMRDDPGQVGHPIRVDHDWMDAHLVDFKPVLKKVLSRHEGRGPEHHYGTYIFAGRKLPLSA
ncbi:MAG: class I SAM-dependent methyltransferase [bacterium]